MTKAMQIGQTIIIDGFPVQINAIAAHYDILDNYVIAGKSDITGHVVAECDITGEKVQKLAYFANAEEAVLFYVERAFGISV